MRNICIWPMFVNICCRARASACGACVHACVNSDTCKKAHNSCTYFYCHAAAAFWLINLKGGKGCIKTAGISLKKNQAEESPSPSDVPRSLLAGVGNPTNSGRFHVEAPKIIRGAPLAAAGPWRCTSLSPLLLMSGMLTAPRMSCLPPL